MKVARSIPARNCSNLEHSRERKLIPASGESVHFSISSPHLKSSFLTVSL